MLFGLVFFLVAWSKECNTSVPPNQSGLMLVIQSIIQDPEYLALSDYQQLMVLEVLYSLLEFGYNNRMKQEKSVNFSQKVKN